MLQKHDGANDRRCGSNHEPQDFETAWVRIAIAIGSGAGPTAR